MPEREAVWGSRFFFKYQPCACYTKDNKKVHTAPLSGTNLIPITDWTVLNININDIKVWA